MAAQVARSGSRRVALPAAPMMHATGLFTALGTLLVGGEVVLLESRQVIFVPAIQRSPVGKADRKWAERTALDATGPVQV